MYSHRHAITVEGLLLIRKLFYTGLYCNTFRGTVICWTMLTWNKSIVSTPYSLIAFKNIPMLSISLFFLIAYRNTMNRYSEHRTVEHYIYLRTFVCDSLLHTPGPIWTTIWCVDLGYPCAFVVVLFFQIKMTRCPGMPLDPFTWKQYLPLVVKITHRTKRYERFKRLDHSYEKLQ